MNNQMEHTNWWNKLPNSEREEIAQKHFERSAKSLTDSDIFKAYHNLHFLLEPEKNKESKVINKLQPLLGYQKYKQWRDDIRTTMLGLSQCLIYMFDELGTEKSIFRQELKRTGNAFMKELEKNMNFYFKLNKEEQFAQADLLNLLCNSIEHNVKLAYRASEMDEHTCDMFLSDYKELMTKYGIENDFLNETTKKNESN